jgi:hypothetical protein
MNFAAWIMSAATVAVLAGAVVLTWIPAYARTVGRRHARRIALALPDDLDDAVTARLLTRLRWIGASGIVVTVAVAAAFAAGPDADRDAPVGLLIAGGGVAGATIGAAFGSLVSRPAASDGVRIARPRAVRPRDYVPPVELVACRVLVPVAAMLFAVAVNAYDRFAQPQRHFTRRLWPDLDYVPYSDYYPGT